MIIWYVNSDFFPPHFEIKYILNFKTYHFVHVFKDKWTALISASKEGHIHIVEELLKCGVNLEHRDMVCTFSIIQH
jgi:ankyrin repeat protein